jgi:hypothetical protein
VVVLGFSHQLAFQGVSVLAANIFETPMGDAVIDRGLSDELVRRCPVARLDTGPHCGEWSAENQVPFLQYALPETPLVVALIGGHVDSTERALADVLGEWMTNRRVQVVASTDMLHDADYDMALRYDRETLDVMTELDPEALARRWRPDCQCLCGVAPTLTAMRAAIAAGCDTATVLAYRNSGDDDLSGRGRWVVGYGVVAITG